MVPRDDTLPSKGSGDSAGSLPVGRRGSAEMQAGRSLLSEDSSHGQSSSQALTHAEVSCAWHIAVSPGYEDVLSCMTVL